MLPNKNIQFALINNSLEIQVKKKLKSKLIKVLKLQMGK